MKRVPAVLRVFLLGQFRAPVNLLLTVLTPPLFVLLFHLFYTGQEPSLAVAIRRGRPGATEATIASGTPDTYALLTSYLSTGTPMDVRIREIEPNEDLSEMIRSGSVDLGIEIPSVLPAAKDSGGHQSAAVIVTVNPAREFYEKSISIVRHFVDTINTTHLGYTPPVSLEQVLVPHGESASSMDRYIPSLLIFSVIMLIFSVSTTVSREVERGHLLRLRLTRASAFEFLAGLSLSQLLLGLIGLGLTIIVARCLGFRGHGHIPLIFVISSFSLLASIGVGLVVASLSRDTTMSLLLASFVMFMLVLFSGLIFPEPDIPVLTILGVTVSLFDALPTTHMSNALAEIMLTSSSADIRYEMALLLFLSFFYFATGVAIFSRFNFSSTRKN